MPDTLPDGITAGPDGNVWFIENNVSKIGRITPEGQVTEVALPIGALKMEGALYEQCSA